jgi:hypothetical protein
MKVSSLCEIACPKGHILLLLLIADKDEQAGTMVKYWNFSLNLVRPDSPLCEKLASHLGYISTN